MTKSNLLCIEGPAGSGKTTLCAALSEYCKVQGLNTHAVSEFSHTPIGRELSGILARFAGVSSKRSAMQDFMHCVADKFSSLLGPPEPLTNITVIDRGFISQTVLVIPQIEDQADLDFSVSLISLCNEWLLSRYHVITLVLQLPEAENFRRLEQRLGRALDSNERQVMRHEIECYAALTGLPDAARIGLRMLDATATPETLAHAIVSNLSTMEHNE